MRKLMNNLVVLCLMVLAMGTTCLAAEKQLYINGKTLEERTEKFIQIEEQCKQIYGEDYSYEVTLDGNTITRISFAPKEKTTTTYVYDIVNKVCTIHSVSVIKVYSMDPVTYEGIYTEETMDFEPITKSITVEYR